MTFLPWFKGLFTILGLIKISERAKTIHIPISPSLQETIKMASTNWPHFSDKELSCPHCGKNEISEEFMWILVAMRKIVGVPFTLNSAYRCPEYDATFGGKGNHVKGAADIRIYGPPAVRIIELAFPLGFTGLGIKQHGEHSRRYIHLDKTHEIPTIWTYS